MQGGVFTRNRQAQPGAPAFARPRGIGPVEAVKDVLGHLFAHANAVVTHPHSHGRIVTHHVNIDGLTFAVFGCVNHQVAQDSLNSGVVDDGGHLIAFNVQADLATVSLS